MPKPHYMPHYGPYYDLKYAVPALGGDTVRVIVAGNTVSLPAENWSHEGYGSSIGADWLLHSCPHKLPGTARKRKCLAAVIEQAVADAALLERAAADLQRNTDENNERSKAHFVDMVNNAVTKELDKRAAARGEA